MANDSGPNLLIYILLRDPKRQSYSQNRIMWRSICNHFMPGEKTDVQRRWQRGERGIREEKEVWGRRQGRWRGRENSNSSVARTPKLVCHSVRQSVYSQAQTQVQYLRRWEYINTRTHKQNTHISSCSINASWKYPPFIPSRSLIRFHHHSNPFPCFFLPHTLPAAL